MGYDLIEVLRGLYRSEINVSIASFYDGGWTVKIGDEMNGFLAETTVDALTCGVAGWLDSEAKRLFPNSLYATGVMPSADLQAIEVEQS